MNLKALLLVIFSALSVNTSPAAEKTVIRLGVMASGTLVWELAAMQNAALPEANGFTLETIPLASQQAGKIALQSASADIIVSDWIWVSAMRAEGADYSFYPYSNSAGGLLVPADSPIKSLADLQGRKLGVAGGELDKNWLLLQALGLKQGLDLNQSVDKIYAAPPLLNQQLAEHRLDAVLTYWQFAARLESEGYRQLLSGEDIISQLGVKDSVPSLGYVFRTDWADEHKAALQAFFDAARIARDRLCSDDAAWQQIGSLTGSDNPATRQQLRKRYCAGRVTQWTDANRSAAESLYQQLHRLSDNKLTGKNPELQTGTFWSAD
ncbi:MAG: ABC transporter substrate-binding protein [Methylococcales bacterium]|nr:ABC transporter substrate-binding protein [Methylococcales bacterium]